MGRIHSIHHAPVVHRSKHHRTLAMQAPYRGPLPVVEHGGKPPRRAQVSKQTAFLPRRAVDRQARPESRSPGYHA